VSCVPRNTKGDEMIKLEVSRDGANKRYELNFSQGISQWSMFLSDNVHNDPRLFSAWIKSLVQEVQYKNGR
jgi:hypothetical protein